jgi:hypothetical protein
MGDCWPTRAQDEMTGIAASARWEIRFK